MSKNIISTSKKEIYTKLLDIAGKYVDIEKSDFAQTGLFGYITESMAMALRDSTFHTGMMYNESFLNTAIIPKSVYNWAKMFNIEVQKATPSYANITITIPESAISSNMAAITGSDLKKYGADIKAIDKGILLNKEDAIVAGEFYFSLEHSIVIYKSTSVDGIETYAAKYILTEYESTNYQGITQANQMLDIKYNNGNYEIYARAYQYRLNKFDRQLTSNTFLNKVQSFEFEGQFCGAKLFSINNGDKTEINLQYSEIKIPGDGETAFYNLANENELEIIFKYGDERYFVPGANSNLLTYIYTTEGRNVPKSFTGTALMLISSTTFKNLPMSITFTDTYIVGGSNIPSLGEIKQTIINEISTRNTITTQADLNNFFAVLTTMIGTVNDGKVSFIKQRDDVIRRLYNAYLLIRDNTNDITHTYANTSFISSCVPTNTINVHVTNVNSSVSTETESNIINLDYARFREDSEGNWVYIPDDSRSNYTDYYMCPFRIRLLPRPVEAIKYVYDIVNSDTRLLYISEGQGEFFTKNYFTPVSLKVRKSTESISINDNRYIFEITVTSNLPLLGADRKSISGSIKLSLGSGGTLSFNVTNNNVVSCNENNGVYTNVIQLIATQNISDNYLSSISLKPVDDGSLEVRNIGSSDLITIDFGTSAIDGMVLGNLKYSTENPVVFFQELDDIMESTISHSVESDIEITEDDAGNISLKSSTDYLIVHDVPVIHSSFLNTSNTDYTLKLNGFTEQLFSYINILKENLNRLETSTFFSLKFYNTYGTSYKYSTAKTNIDLELKIKLLDIYKTGDETETQLKREIRSYIRRIVDKTNETGMGLKYSDIVSATMQNGAYGKYIEYINFLGINDTFTQYISPISDSASYEDISSTTPEWLNLDADTIDTHIIFE